MNIFPSGVPLPEAPPLRPALRYAAIAKASQLLNCWRHRQQRCDYRSIRPAKPDALQVNYGRVNTGPQAEIVIGGAVKLLSLRRRFGEALDEFNILYLVSSALPPAVGALVRKARRQGIKMVWNQNGTVYPACAGWRYPWINEPMARLLPLADYVVYQSEFCRRSADRYLGHTALASEILFNPVDVRAFAPSPRPPVSEGWRLLAAGTSHGFYRIQSALDALAELVRRKKNVHLTIAGEFRWTGGSEQVRDYIATHGLGAQVTLQPPFTRQEAPQIYRGVHLLIHPKYKDPCPTVPIEAMACGLPIVGSASGGMPELVPSSCGRLLPVAESWRENHAPDPVEMANAVETVFAEYSRFSKAARCHAVGVFSEEIWLDRHEEIFRRLLA